MPKLTTILRYRVRYYWRTFLQKVIGRCPDCGNKLNYTRTKRPICPECNYL